MDESTPCSLEKKYYKDATDWYYYFCVALSRVQLFVTPQTAAHQAPLSTEFSRQEYWSGWPLPTPGIFLTQGPNSHFLHLPHWHCTTWEALFLFLLSHFWSADTDTCLATKDRLAQSPKLKAKFSPFSSSGSMNNQLEHSQSVLSNTLAPYLLGRPSSRTLFTFSAILTLLSYYWGSILEFHLSHPVGSALPRWAMLSEAGGNSCQAEHPEAAADMMTRPSTHQHTCVPTQPKLKKAFIIMEVQRLPFCEVLNVSRGWIRAQAMKGHYKLYLFKKRKLANGSFYLKGGKKKKSHFQLGEWKDKCSKVHSAEVISAFETPPVKAWVTQDLRCPINFSQPPAKSRCRRRFKAKCLINIKFIRFSITESIVKLKKQLILRLLCIPLLWSLIYDIKSPTVKIPPLYYTCLMVRRKKERGNLQTWMGVRSWNWSLALIRKKPRCGLYSGNSLWPSHRGRQGILIPHHSSHLILLEYWDQHNSWLSLTSDKTLKQN